MSTLALHARRAIAGLEALQPLALLAARLYLAQVFFLAGLSKLRDWDITLALFADEYQVPLLPSELAAWLGTGGELVLPVLLALGLFGRFAALGLFIVEPCYRLSDGLDDAAGGNLRLAMSEYLTVAVRDDWPAMAGGSEGAQTTAALDRLYQAVLAIQPANSRDDQILYELLYQLDQLTQARRDRLVAATGIVPGLLWLVLFGGGLVTVGFTFFFGNRNVAAQSLMTGMLTLLISSALLVVVAIDHPFAGTVHVGPDALVSVLRELGD